MSDTCDGFIVYENYTGGGGAVTFGDSVKQLHDIFIQYFGLGYGCGDLRPAFDQYMDPATSPWFNPAAKTGYVKPGQAFNSPDVDIVFPDAPETHWGLNSTPLSLGVTFELRVRRNGLIESRGTIDYGYFVNAPEKDPDQIGALITWRQSVTNNLTGGFPIIIGQDGVESVSWGFGNYAGTDKPWTGSVEYVYPGSGGNPDITYTATFVDNVTGNFTWASVWDGVNIPNPDCVATYQIPSGVNDIEGFWCCLTFGFDCCGPAPVGIKSGFLIPRPSEPATGEENVNTPILKTPLYLSNHTFQFPANFWRK